MLFFRKIQQKNNYDLTKNDFLCDYSTLVFFTRFMSYLDNVSLRIKTKIFPEIDENNSKRVNDKISSDLFWMNYSDAIKEKNLRRISFVGYKNPKEYYKRASILLLVSEYEGFGLVIVESMAYGIIPIVLVQHYRL